MNQISSWDPEDPNREPVNVAMVSERVVQMQQQSQGQRIKTTDGAPQHREGIACPRGLATKIYYETADGAHNTVRG